MQLLVVDSTSTPKMVSYKFCWDHIGNFYSANFYIISSASAGICIQKSFSELENSYPQQNSIDVKFFRDKVYKFHIFILSSLATWEILSSLKSNNGLDIS